MKAVIQRVDCAGVKINQKELSSIKSGILIFLGVEKGDAIADADYILDKAINLRIFEDNDGKMNLGLVDIGGEMLVVSQFTLLADCRKGR
ncbi:MAG: D-tyrosyl-tRNA(Tyr) deacylase, partial [Deltaproteobacteria bacterium]|nr:D-tyrosyl-tRNA(Tyr) deacylase [Deltaproteobacteria bacterium]